MKLLSFGSSLTNLTIMNHCALGRSSVLCGTMVGLDSVFGMSRNGENCASRMYDRAMAVADLN